MHQLTQDGVADANGPDCDVLGDYKMIQTNGAMGHAYCQDKSGNIFFYSRRILNVIFQVLGANMLTQMEFQMRFPTTVLLCFSVFNFSRVITGHETVQFKRTFP